MLRELALLALSACVSYVATWRVRQHAISGGILDVPNARSSHTHPTPRGGGLAIFVVVAAGLVLLWMGSAVSLRALLAGGIGGSAIAFVGYWDDKHNMSARLRFAVHSFAALIAITLLCSSPDARPLFGNVPPWISISVLVVGVVWSVNLFNFMDGIDGIAGSQAVFVAGAGAALAAGGAESGWVMLCVVTAGASLGFLVWNWSPARIFMGDVGSGFLGFWLAVLAIGLHVSGSLSVWTSVILNSVFVADATITLLRRMVNGHRWYEAHRSHAYQHLARRWGSHRRVTALIWMINIVLVLPLAHLSVLQPAVAPWIACSTLLSMALAFALVGAGKSATELSD